MFFGDEKLKKYYTRNQAGDLKKFRQRIHTNYPTKDFEKMIYVFITDVVRGILLDTIGELSTFLKPMGNLIISGGEAFNLHMPVHDRIITSDIDAKFVPTIPFNSQYFGKLQAIKLLLWNKLGEIAKKLNIRLKNALLKTTHKKFTKFTGFGFKQSGPYVTRRYTLIKKKKTGTTKTPSKGDVFIDVELFALDLNARLFSPASGRIEDYTVGGILDIPFMRPKEFGYDVAKTFKKGISYRKYGSPKITRNPDIYVAGKEFLIEDIYLMQKLGLRPEKREKDRQRLFKLVKSISTSVTSRDSVETIFNKVKRKLRLAKTMKIQRGKVNMQKALRVNPRNYETYTTRPSVERLSKQIVHAVKPSVNNNIIIEGYEKTHGNQRFNTNTLTWKPANNISYIQNEFPLRPIEAKPLPPGLNTQATLYGFKPRRDGWVPQPLLKKVADIPFIGLKK
jgi:hypothetical protein